MEQGKKSRRIFIAVLIIAIIVGLIAIAFGITKGDTKKLSSVLTGGQATKVVGKIELQGDLEITKPYQEEWEEVRIYSN